MKRTMKLMLLALLADAPLAYAAAGDQAGIGLGAFIFLGFVALIVVFQAVPGLILFYSMLKGLFGSVACKTAAPALGNSPENLR